MDTTVGLDGDAVGSSDGCAVGAEGCMLGTIVDVYVGISVGGIVGNVGAKVVVGRYVGLADGSGVGRFDGETLGTNVVGNTDGIIDGEAVVGIADGTHEGIEDGGVVGTSVEGRLEGGFVGWADGINVGKFDGDTGG